MAASSLLATITVLVVYKEILARSICGILLCQTLRHLLAVRLRMVKQLHSARTTRCIGHYQTPFPLRKGCVACETFSSQSHVKYGIENRRKKSFLSPALVLSTIPGQQFACSAQTA